MEDRETPDPEQDTGLTKQEYIHIHGLLTEVSSYMGEDENIRLDLETYEELDTDRYSIHADREEHREAVNELLDSITDAVTGDYNPGEE